MSNLRFMLLMALAAAARVAGAVLPPECAPALEALQSEEAALLKESAQLTPESKRREALRRLDPLRLGAAKACLGGVPATPPPSQHTVRPPIVAPSVTITMPAPVPRASPASLPPVARPSPPVTLGACDAAGCTASDGTRLQRAGSQLIGPRGLCTLQGTLLICP